MASTSDNSPEVDLLGQYERCYKGSAKTNIADYFEDFHRILTNSGLNKPDDVDEKSFIASVIGPEVDAEKFDLLQGYCSIDNLDVPGELERTNKARFEWCKENDPEVLDNLTLQTVRCVRQRNRLKSHQITQKYRSERPVMYEEEPVVVDENSPMLIPEKDILVFVRVYVPFTSRSKQSTGALGKLSINCVIAIAGSQTLDKLRDLITCESDNSISREMSDEPDLSKTGVNAKNVYKSGFFFIEDTFYNDFRDPNNKDNSKVIREWAKSRKLGDFKTEAMENTRIDSLDLRFGFPWVYQHQGDCEHLISFSDARFVSQSDELNLNFYPRIVRIKPRPNRYCMTCGIYNVCWITTSNSRLPHNPCMFCDSCFKSYNYIKGKKIGSFKAYPFPYDAEIKNLMSKRDLKMELRMVENDVLGD